MRILVALEPRSYSEAIGETIQNLRPHLKVTVAKTDELGPEVESLATELVLCSSRKPASEGDGGPVWIEYRPYTEPKATIRVDERHLKLDVVELVDLLSVVDRAEGLARMIPSPEAQKRRKIFAGGD